MKIYIEAKEVNVRITDNDNEEVFGYSTANYSVFMNVTMFITMAVGLIKHMMGLETKSKVGGEAILDKPARGQRYFLVQHDGICQITWDNDTTDNEHWSEGNVFLNFDTAAVEYKARHCV